MEPERLRKQLNEPDSQRVQFPERCFRLNCPVDGYKRDHHLPDKDQSRENGILRRNRERITDPVAQEQTGTVYRTIFSASRQVQGERDHA